MNSFRKNGFKKMALDLLAQNQFKLKSDALEKITLDQIIENLLNLEWVILEKIALEKGTLEKITFEEVVWREPTQFCIVTGIYNAMQVIPKIYPLVFVYNLL